MVCGHWNRVGVNSHDGWCLLSTQQVPTTMQSSYSHLQMKSQVQEIKYITQIHGGRISVELKSK